MDSNYTYKNFKKDLDNGFQIHLTYINNRFLVFRTAKNCYTVQLLSEEEKNPQPKIQIVTLKRLKEIFKSATDLEY